MGYRWSADDASLSEGFVRIAREQAEKAATGAVADDRPPARRIHEARRRCKKLRALMRLVRSDFRSFKRENRLVRDAARHLAEARDANVVRTTLTELYKWAEQPDPGLTPLPEDEALERQVLERFAEEMRELKQRISAWRVEAIDEETIIEGLGLAYRDARHAGAQSAARPTDEGFHDWRKLAKYHWHHLGLLRECAGGLLESEARAAGELADLLGRHHDLAVLLDELKADPLRFGEGIDAAFVNEAARRRQAGLEVEIDRLRLQVFAERPKALKDRVRAYLDSYASREAAE